jgi:hypothetical protein
MPLMNHRAIRIIPRQENIRVHVWNEGELGFTPCNFIASHLDITNLKNTRISP